MAIENRETISQSREPAPNPEWVLMYRNGLPGRRIAELTDVPGRTVSYHLRLARAADPELRPAHEAAAKAKKPQVTARGLEQMKQVISTVQQTGRYPSRSAASTTERTLAVWLQRRRKEPAPHPGGRHHARPADHHHSRSTRRASPGGSWPEGGRHQAGPGSQGGPRAHPP